MDKALLRSIVPYAVGLAIAARSSCMRARSSTRRGPANSVPTCGRALPSC